METGDRVYELETSSGHLLEKLLAQSSVLTDLNAPRLHVDLNPVVVSQSSGDDLLVEMFLLSNDELNEFLSFYY